jgi:hypothetical protein
MLSSRFFSALRSVTHICELDRVLFFPDCVVQEVKNNKQDSIALANHAGEIASQLFVALKSLDDRDSMKANLESFVK